MHGNRARRTLSRLDGSPRQAAPGRSAPAPATRSAVAARSSPRRRPLLVARGAACTRITCEQTSRPAQLTKVPRAQLTDTPRSSDDRMAAQGGQRRPLRDLRLEKVVLVRRAPILRVPKGSRGLRDLQRLSRSPRDRATRGILWHPAGGAEFRRCTASPRAVCIRSSRGRRPGLAQRPLVQLYVASLEL